MRPVIALGGLTAGGKSDLALALAEALEGEIINADSMQVYRGLETITACPDGAERARCPHHLFAFMDPAEACTAGAWRGLAAAEIDAVLARGRAPILVGGTGLYLGALIAGLSPMPEVAPRFRDAARAELERRGPAGLHAHLAELDPGAAALIRASDRQRLTRALEVYLATGRRWSDFRAAPTMPLHHKVACIALCPPREAIADRAGARFDAMLARGALAEARALAARALPADLPAMKAIGVPPLLAHLAGALTLEAARDRAVADTLAYAKRQRTWFRTQFTPEKLGPACAGLLRLDRPCSPDLAGACLAFLSGLDG